jgi:hypothetical protein
MQNVLSVPKFNNILCVLFSDVNEFGDIESCNLYLSLQQHLRSVENSCENLQKDVTLKKFRFELQVNIIMV